MFGDTIVKVTSNTCGHNYIIGDFYFISRVQAQSGYHKLLAILPKINLQGSTLQDNGNNIDGSNFVRVDTFGSNEELVAFLKEKEAILLASVISAVKEAVSFREEIKKITDFDNKEDYMTSRIQECKDALSKDCASEDDQGKQILALLNTLA